MQKLEKAGWLTHRAEGRSYVYVPTRSRDEAGTSTLRTFIDRVFCGDPLLLFQHLLEDEELSDHDLSALKKMIDQKRRKEGRHA
jgi:BlaI family penicillinase repressor